MPENVMRVASIEELSDGGGAYAWRVRAQWTNSQQVEAEVVCDFPLSPAAQTTVSVTPQSALSSGGIGVAELESACEDIIHRVWNARWEATEKAVSEIVNTVFTVQLP